jgi:hypothetical protein
MKMVSTSDVLDRHLKSFAEYDALVSTPQRAERMMHVRTSIGTPRQ